jgi:hypothetical protein
MVQDNYQVLWVLLVVELFSAAAAPGISIQIPGTDIGRYIERNHLTTETDTKSLSKGAIRATFHVLSRHGSSCAFCVPSSSNLIKLIIKAPKDDANVPTRQLQLS